MMNLRNIPKSMKEDSIEEQNDEWLYHFLTIISFTTIFSMFFNFFIALIITMLLYWCCRGLLSKLY